MQPSGKRSNPTRRRQRGQGQGQGQEQVRVTNLCREQGGGLGGGIGRKVEQYAHRLGPVVSQFIVDSLGCPADQGRTQWLQIDWRTCSWAASAIGNCIYDSINVKRAGEKCRAEQRGKLCGRGEQPCALIDSATNAQHGKCIIYL